MATPTIPMQKANTLIKYLEQWGFIKKVSPGKYVPLVVVKCGTCEHFKFHPEIGTQAQYGNCALKGNKNMRENCSQHVFSLIYQQLIQNGLTAK